MRALLLALAQVTETAHALLPLYERGARLLSQLASFAQPVPDDAVRWLEVTRQHLRLMAGAPAGHGRCQGRSRRTAPGLGVYLGHAGR